MWIFIREANGTQWPSGHDFLQSRPMPSTVPKAGFAESYAASMHWTLTQCLGPNLIMTSRGDRNPYMMVNNAWEINGNHPLLWPQESGQ